MTAERDCEACYKAEYMLGFLGQTFPGEIYPPEDGDITVSWPSRTSVELYMAVRPYNCPKKITCNLFLDLNNYAA